MRLSDSRRLQVPAAGAPCVPLPLPAHCAGPRSLRARTVAPVTGPQLPAPSTRPRAAPPASAAVPCRRRSAQAAAMVVTDGAAPAAAWPGALVLTAAEDAAPKLNVCVTGAGGYIASWIVARLLAGGHTVRAAVRSRSKAEFLSALPGAAGRLTFCEGCDLTAPRSFDAAIAGCDAVIHTASPFALGVKGDKVKELLLDPAVNGTRNVLDSVNRSPSVRSVVLTSSVTAVYSWPVPGKVYSEDDWNDQASERAFAYEYSKTLAERAAWEAAAGAPWRLVTLLPGLVFGPPLSRHHSAAQSPHIMRRMLRGDMAPGYPDYRLKAVDVRDVAKAHVLALVNPGANGRYLLAPLDFTFGGVARILAQGPMGRRSLAFRLRLPSAPLFKWLLWLIADIINIERDRLETSYGVALSLDASRAAEGLGLGPWLPQEATYNDMAEAMVALGMIRWMAPRASPLFDLYQSGPEAGAALAAAAARCHPLW